MTGIIVLLFRRVIIHLVYVNGVLHHTQGNKSNIKHIKHQLDQLLWVQIKQIQKCDYAYNDNYKMFVFTKA